MSVTSDRVYNMSFPAILRDVREFAAGPAKHYSAQIERDGTIPVELRRDLCNRGFLSLLAPKAYGGAGLPYPSYLELMEIFGMCHGSLRLVVHVANAIWRAIDCFATEAQRQHFVLPSVRGEICVSFALTERLSGSGADLRTHATRVGDNYLITGEKHLTCFGVTSDYWLVFARVAGSVGAAGTLALMVDRRTEGVTVTEMPDMMGCRGTDHAQLVFDNARVPVANRLGDEGDGLKVAFGGFLTPSRIAVAMSCVGLARKANELAMRHAVTRRTYGTPLAERQAVQFMIAENATDIEASRQLCLFAGRRWQDGAEDALRLASLAKLNAVEAVSRVTDRALQIHGGIGYCSSSEIERVYRDARAQRFEEGPNEAHKAIIARAEFGGRCEHILG